MHKILILLGFRLRLLKIIKLTDKSHWLVKWLVPPLQCPNKKGGRIIKPKKTKK
jgi:hypothetical protein